MNRYTEDLRHALIELVASKSTTMREAAKRVGVSYSTATRWVLRSRTRALVPTKPTARFAQLVRETDADSAIHVRVGRAEITVRRGVDVRLLRTVVEALSGDGL